MRIHTNLTDSDIYASVPASAHIVSLTEHGSRSRTRAFEVKLSGSSRNRTMDGANYAATWDEWGAFIASIFDKDDNAIAGEYKSAKLFHYVTACRFDDGMPEDTHSRHKWEYGGTAHHCAKCSASMDFHTLRNADALVS